jgi:hypothetical protein
MGETEWNKYAYDLSQKYYNDLAAMYVGDDAKYAEIQ